MTLKDIKKAVNAALREKYPEYKIYGADTVEGYTRPSFFVYVTQTFSESTRNAIHKNVEVEIDFIQKSPDEMQAMEFFSEMEKLFCQKLTVGEHFLSTGEFMTGFEGENVNIPVVSFDIEYWDMFKRKDNSVKMGQIIIRQEV